MKCRTVAGILAVSSALVPGTRLAAQEPITVPLSFEKKLDSDGHGFAALFEFQADRGILHEGARYEVVPPALNPERATAYAFLYFTGLPDGVIPQSIVMLIEGYDGDDPRFFVDVNNDHDFTNDPPAVEREGDAGKYIVTLQGDAPEHLFRVRFGPMTGPLADDPSQLESMMAGYLERMGGVPTSAKHWLADQRLNVMSASTTVSGVPVQLGLYDYNSNGRYDDPEDMVVIGEHGAKHLPRSKSSGATTLAGDSVVRIGDQNYEVIEADSAGRFLRMVATDKELTMLVEGAMLPDLEITLLDGTEATLRSFVAPGKTLLIDFWGHWCKGCITAFPKLRELHAARADRLTILGMHFGQHDVARRMIETEQLSWQHGQVTEAIKDAFLVDRWPFYVVVDDHGRVLRLNARLTEVDEILAR